MCKKNKNYKCPECGSRYVKSIMGGRSDKFSCLKDGKVRIIEKTPMEEGNKAPAA